MSVLNEIEQVSVEKNSVFYDKEADPMFQYKHGTTYFDPKENVYLEFVVSDEGLKNLMKETQFNILGARNGILYTSFWREDEFDFSDSEILPSKIGRICL